MTRRTFLGLLLAIAVAMAAAPIHAATIVVTTTVDELTTNGNCSLREAVRAANTNAAVDACPAGQNDQTDTITVPAGTYTLALAGLDNDASAGDLDLLDNTAVDDLVISGAGAATTIVQACTVDQQAADCPAGQGVVERVFHVIDGSAAISGVTVRHGRAPVFGSRHSGHGIYIQKINGIAPPVLALTDAVVTKNGRSNEAQESNGGGIANEDSTLTLTRVSVTDNIAGGGSGGGIYNSKLTDGAPILTMTDSTVSGNEAAGHGGGIANKDFGTATLTGCTISDNETAFGGGGGFYNGFNSATATLTNCTVSGNRSNGSFGGGIYNTGGTMSLRSTTVTLNRLGQGQGAGGINTISSPVVLRNSIVAGNIHELNPASPQYSPDCDAGGGLSISSEGHNLVGDGFQCPSLVDGLNGDQIGTTGTVIDAKLGPLADNGGPTLTHGWLPDSPAIDAADPAPPGSGGTACPTTDQRGETRPSGAACDVGSFEGSGGGAIAAFSVHPSSGGTAGTVQLRVFGDGFVTGAVLRLVRAGFADVVGGETRVHGTVVTTSLDLHDVAPGAWSVEVKNPDASVATLLDAFTVVAGGEPDVWVEFLTPRGFQGDRVQSIYVLVGNSGTVDAYGVPLWVAFGEALRWFIPFVVSPPPAQPGQIATDWSAIAIDLGRPPSPAIPEQADSFHFLLPIVPAGSSSAFRIRVKSPPFGVGAPASINVATNWGDPYFQPDLRAEVVAFYVSQAKDYAVTAHGTTTFPADAAIEAYVRTQLAAVIAEGRVAAVGNETGDLPIYSQAQLIIDTGQFIAGESATASATSADRGWLARIVAELVGGSAEARFVGPLPDPCAGLNYAPARFSCEQEIDPCRHGCNNDDDAPKIPPVVPCVGAIKFVLNLLGVPCDPPKPVPLKPRPRPTPRPVPFQSSHDPNEKAGPGGPGGFIDGVTPLSYTVTFENIKTATGDAFEVLVTDQLDVAKYDLDTFSLGPISFADKFVSVPPGLETFSTEVDMRPGVNILVGVDAALDTTTGLITWKFTTLDPATHEFPEDPEDGFLPPNVTSPEGEGEMLFTVSLKPGFGLGTTVCNDASIVFDFNAPIVTNEFCNTIGAPEDCENCIDDDGDGNIDRADADCAAPANGAGGGADTAVAKAVDKCAKTIRKVGAKLTSNRLKQLGACQKAVADCVQLKAKAPACLLKAQMTCTKARTGLAAAEAKLTETIVKACGEPALAPANLFAAVGVGFDGEVAACEQRGLDGVDTPAEVAECVRQQHVCAAERLLGAAVPRALELLVLGGIDPATDLSCVPSGANGGGLALAADKQKAIRKCDAAIQKATAKLLAGRAKAGQACGGALFTCVQTKPGAPCLTKAGGACGKAFGALPKLAQSFATTIAKACNAAPLVPADLLGADGLGASALAATCAQLGVANFQTVDDVTTCLAKQITCSVDHLLESETPRLGELLDLGGVALP